MTMRVALAFCIFFVAGCSESSTAAPPPVVKCVVGQDNRCDCDTRENPSGAEVACSKASLGSPSLCCAEPSFASSKTGGCSCTGFACTKSTGSSYFCQCDTSVAGGERVSSCANPSGAKCCLVANKQYCECRDDGLAMACEGGTLVDSCTVDLVDKTCATQFSSFSAEVTSCRD